MSVRVALVAALGASVCAALLAPTGAQAGYSTGRAQPAVVGAGNGWSVALYNGGTVRTWGGNAYGVLGNGTTTASSTPVEVRGYSGTAPLDHVVQVAAGGGTGYALRSDGTVAAWGDSDFGQLGNHTDGIADHAVQVLNPAGTGPLTNVVAISAGAAFALALRADGSVVAWGEDGQGQLGDGAAAGTSDLPVVVHGPSGGTLAGIVAVSAGYLTSYALTSSGTVYAWGDAEYGALGSDDTTPSAIPVEVHGVGNSGVLSHVVSIAAGSYAALALRSDGTVVSWGYGGIGQQGTGSTSDNHVPVVVTALGDHIASIQGDSYGYAESAVSATGAVYEWGQKAHGDFGDGDTTDNATVLSPEYVAALTGDVQLAHGFDHAVAVDAHGAVTAWGDNGGHALGDGSTVSTSTPTHPYALPTIGAPKLFLRVAPVLGGHAQVGYTLTVTAGTWGLPATSIAVAWLRDGKPIAGATHYSYRATSADKGHSISARVTAGRYGYPSNYVTTRSVAITH